MAFFTGKSKGKGPKSGCLGIVKETDVSFTPPRLDFRITLEARNPARRCFRQYRVEAGTDLFGVWLDGFVDEPGRRSRLTP